MEKVKAFVKKNKIAVFVVVVLVGVYGTYRIMHHQEVLKVRKAQQAAQKQADKAAKKAAAQAEAPAQATATPTPTTTAPATK